MRIENYYVWFHKYKGLCGVWEVTSLGYRWRNCIASKNIFIRCLDDAFIGSIETETK